MKKMKIRILMIAFLGMALMAQAQSFGSVASSRGEQKMQTGTRYSGVVYEPFTGSLPSEQSAVGASYSPARGGLRMIGGASGRNPGDVSTGSTESPVGDAVLPLLLAAACYGLFLLRRKRLAANR